MSVDDADAPEDSDRPVGFRVTLGPPGVTVVPNVTVPENPLTLVRVIVDGADDP